MAPAITCHCGACRKCHERERRRELRHGIDRDRVCSARDCETVFYAQRANARFCSARCRTREASRRFQKTTKRKIYVENWNAANPSKQSQYTANWYAQGGKAVRVAYRTDAVKRRAHYAVTRALQTGSLLRRPCEICGSSPVDAHHPDYKHPLEVRWLCRKHHVAVHAGEVVLSQR